MDLGKMRYRIDIEEYKSGTDKDGFTSKNWSKVCTVWADIVPISGKEYLAADTETAEISFKIYIRFRDGIDNTMRVVWNEHVFELAAVLGDKRSGILTLMAREVL